MTPFVFADNQNTPYWFEHNKRWLENEQIDNQTFEHSEQYLLENNLMNDSAVLGALSQSVNYNISEAIDLNGVEHFVNFTSNSNVPGCEKTQSCLVPTKITIDIGDSVTWTTDYGVNTITAGDLFVDPNLVGLDYPNGFDSGLMIQGESFTHQFTVEGTYPYFSMVRPWISGVVTVQQVPVLEPQKITCGDETIDGGIYKSITVVNDSSCSMQNVNVLKYIKANNATNIKIISSNVTGSVLIDYPNNITIQNSTISKNLILENSKSLVLDGSYSSIGNNFVIKNSYIYDVNFSNGAVGKNTRIIDNQAYLNRIGSADLEFISNNLSGNLVIKNNTIPDIYLEKNTVSNNLKISFNDIEDNIALVSNFFGHGVIISNNTSDKSQSIEDIDLTITNNTITKNLLVKNNHLDVFDLIQTLANERIRVVNNSIASVWLSDNTSDLEIKIKNNVINEIVKCENNSPELTMKKNVIAGVPSNECVPTS